MYPRLFTMPSKGEVSAPSWGIYMYMSAALPRKYIHMYVVIGQWPAVHGSPASWLF